MENQGHNALRGKMISSPPLQRAFCRECFTLLIDGTLHHRSVAAEREGSLPTLGRWIFEESLERAV